MLSDIERASRRKISLAFLLSGLVALSVFITIAIVLIISYRSEKTSLVETSLAMNYSKAKDLSRTIDSIFQSMRKSLGAASAVLRERGSRPDQEILDDLELIRNTSGYFNSILWVDEVGVLREVTPYAIGKVGQRLTSEAALESLSSRRPYLSSPYIGSTGRLIVLMSEPIFNPDGTYGGFVGGTIYLQEDNVLSAILGNSQVDAIGTYYYVVDRKGRLLYHPDLGRLGEDASGNPVIGKLMQGGTGWMRSLIRKASISWPGMRR
ncbi:cache domain-containing protein [Paenibacillus sp. P26]|nr:cache domain-containing protein [Paenibacillus sp. P26]